MWWILLLLAVLAAAPATALRPSHRAPVIFVPTILGANATEHRGVSIRKDGAWVHGHIRDELETRIRTVFPLSTLLVINTDDETLNHDEIHEWMKRECFQIQRRVAQDCFVVSTASYPPFKSATDPYEFKRWESSLKRVVRHSLDPLDITPLGTLRPTMPITPSPVVPVSCESRLERDCVGEECQWYGVFFGCRKPGFCGFTTKMACEHHGCQFVRNRCRSISSKL